ncbi:MAG: complex I NDUFA9 subunit family protein [Capsulimonadaceae bacterium]|nr:complex I NDUFA9 subunit family protein [Capsulimonadaceae bacterium]
MRVLVIGASGFVGSYAVQALVEAGHQVIGASRTLPEQSRWIAEARYVAGVDVGDIATLAPGLFDNIDVVVHLAGIIRERGESQTFQRIHVDGTKNIVARAKAAESVDKLIYISAIGSDADAPSKYSRTKSLAEDLVIDSGLPFVILRPSIILGAGGEFSAQMRDLVLHGGLPVDLPFPVIPVPGDGRTQFQPVHAGDLMRCLVAAVGLNVADNATVEIGGSTRVTFNEILDAYASRLGVRKPKLHAPLPLLMAVAPFLELLPNPPVTRDQLRNLSKDNVCDIADMRRRFKVEPLSFEQAMDLTVPRAGAASGGKACRT